MPLTLGGGGGGCRGRAVIRVTLCDPQHGCVWLVFPSLAVHQKPRGWLWPPGVLSPSIRLCLRGGEQPPNISPGEPSLSSPLHPSPGDTDVQPGQAECRLDGHGTGSARAADPGRAEDSQAKI